MDSYRKKWDPHPRELAGFFGLTFFTWTLSIFRQDRKQQLDPDNIWAPYEKLKSAKLGDRLDEIWLNHVGRQKKKGKDPSLAYALAVTFWKEIVWMKSLQLFTALTAVLLQPYLLGELISSFSRESDPWDISIVAGELILLNFFNGLASAHFLFQSPYLGLSMKIAVITAVFRKSLKLSKTALNDVSPGQIVNLVSNDVSRFEIFAVASSFLWSGPLQTVIVAYFLYRDVGWFGFVGMAVVAAVTILQTYTAQLTSKFRRKIARESDKRIRLTDEVLAGILVIKLYAWEKPFAKLLDQARQAELRYVRRSNFIRGIYMAFNISTTKLALCLTLSTYILSGFTLTTAEVFVISTYYSILNHTMSSIFVRGVQELAELRVSLRRLQGFLLLEEVQQRSIMPSTTVKEDTKDEPDEETPLKDGDESESRPDDGEASLKSNGKVSSSPTEEKGPLPDTQGDLAIVVHKAKASWVEGRMVPTLSNLTFAVRQGQLIGLIGSVGESSLLNLLLGELKHESGKVFVNGTLSYASQEPWIFAGTVRDNILLGRRYNRVRYKKVIAASCLTRDLEIFPDGDLTMVGERGASLSGGQRARINLARAIYEEARVYLLDDPLSAVDAHVAKDMFQNCFKGFLRHKTVILATHQLQFLDQVDKIIFLQVGQIKDMGNFEDLMARGHDFTKMVEECQAVSEKPADPVSPTPDGQRSRSQTISENEQTSTMGSAISISKTADGKKQEEETKLVKDSDTNAPYEGNIYIDYLKAGGAVGMFLAFFFLLVSAQFFVSFSDFWVSQWAKSFDLKIHPSGISNSSLDLLQFNLNSSASGAEESSNSTMDWENENTTVSDDLLTGIWTNTTKNETFSPVFAKAFGLNTNDWSDEVYATVYTTAVGLLVILSLLRGIVFVICCLKCSAGLHSSMVQSALHTDISYFNNNPSGSILNKFSKDLGATDEMLPKAILDTSQTMCLAVGGIVNTLIVNYFLLFPLGLFFLGSILIRNYYMRTSTNLKRISNMTLGPVYTHLNTSLQGLSTIRALSAEQYLKKAFDFHQDLNSSCMYSYMSVQAGYSYFLDVLSLIYISAVIFSCIWASQGIDGADLGLAVTQSMMMVGMLQWGTRQSSEVVNMMTSVERLANFTKLPPEDPNEADKKDAPKDWPTKGAIKLENVSLRYKPEGPPALDCVNVVIRPGEKIGIVGRTGAGKSTLTSVLFRLAPVEGDCIIDDIDTSTLALQSLRSSLAIIPQNPVLFSGNLRRNLDPFEQHPDHDLWSALEDIDLNEIAKDGQGLDSRISDCGNNLSVGQRQLVCLARAVLKNRNIIVLDEATASVDPETDAQIQKTIRKRFANCTVLTIAHRLNTIMDSDRILVMDAGRAVELDSPHNLLLNKEGYFYSLVQETGPQMSARLTNQALENHLKAIEEKKENEEASS